MKIIKTSAVPKEQSTDPLFTGNPAYRQAVLQGDDSDSFSGGIVHFTAGSRNRLHQHTSEQILIVTEGTGVIATEREERTITEGDIVVIPAGENHWHGAPGSTPMSHIAITAKGSKLAITGD